MRTPEEIQKFIEELREGNEEDNKVIFEMQSNIDNRLFKIEVLEWCLRTPVDFPVVERNTIELSFNAVSTKDNVLPPIKPPMKAPRTSSKTADDFDTEQYI